MGHITAWDGEAATHTCTDSGVYDEASFYFAEKFNPDIGHWDASGIKSLALTFAGADIFNTSLVDWDKGNVTNMLAAFAGATAFNQDLDEWAVSRVV